MKNIALVFFFTTLSACTSLEKRHYYNFQSTDESFAEVKSCKDIGHSKPIQIADTQFYFKGNFESRFVGTLFIPFIPTKMNMKQSKIYLYLRSSQNVPANKISIRTDPKSNWIDGIEVENNFENSNYTPHLKDKLIVFNIPDRSLSQNFQLKYAVSEKPLILEYSRTTHWVYRSIEIPMGDEFPYIMKCD